MIEPIFLPGMIVVQKGDKRRWKVPGESDYPGTCDWSADQCIMCAALSNFKEKCIEYVLMELDQIGLPTGKIDTHVCEKTLKLAK